jgi:formylglycine-generating enzyme required for sulfatase activity
VGRTCTGGSYPANAWGLCDMHGNVWEWCQDWYDKDYYRSGNNKDPEGPQSGVSRVLRGGNWSIHAARRCRAATRFCNSNYPFHTRQGPPVDVLMNGVGFRVRLRLD